jgi:Zn-dependent protease
MRLAWKLGRVAGIDFYVHPTFLVVFFLFPGIFPGGAVSPLNILLVLTVFGCVLLHELGHALTARRFGINTHDITLYPIGGVARLERMPRAPGAELLIALAGPAVNFAIVLGLIAIFFLGGDV